jgi:hypothetical protein
LQKRKCCTGTRHGGGGGLIAVVELGIGSRSHPSVTGQAAKTDLSRM